MIRALLAGCFLLLTITPLAAEEIAVGDGVTLQLTLPPGWVLHTEAPDPLVAEIAEHIGHEAEAAGQNPTEDQVLRAARKRLAANEAIAYHGASESHLDIDFSPLEKDENPPSSKQLKKSAEYAAQSLEGEEGVSQVKSEVTKTRVLGNIEAYRLDATYRHHDEPVSFIGVIGYVQNHWFFFYFTAPGQHPDAVGSIEALMDSMSVITN